MFSKLRKLFGSQKFYSLVGSVLTAGFSLVNFGLLARALSKEDFGLWSLFLAVFGLFEMIRNGLVGRPLIKMASEGDDDHFLSLVASSLKIGLRVTFLLSLLVGVAFTVIWLFVKDTFYLNSTFWFFMAALVTIPLSFANWTNTAKIRFDRMVMVNGSRRFLFMVGAGIIFYFDLGLQWVFIMYTASAALTSLLSVLLGWTSLRKAMKRKAEHVKQIFDFGKYSMGTMLGTSALTSSDSFIIMAFLGPEALAIYNIPMRIIGLYDIPLRALVQIAYPHIS